MARVSSERSTLAEDALLTRLVYELLDAHDDTARLAPAWASDDVRWRAHIDYLRDLQRVAREVLADTTRRSTC